MSTILKFWPSLALLCLSAIPAAYMVLHDTGKARWFGDKLSFFGEKQYLRKYKRDPYFTINEWVKAPDTWYYRFFKIKYKEAFLFSATFLVSFVDAYHSSQLVMRILMSLSITLAISAPWWAVIAIWWTYAGVHALFYKILSQ
jgi:hypothetical protein